jgi:3-deoxy-manno-octulosonate cytidylyltransferase (CMP-KDO synthetase)
MIKSNAIIIPARLKSTRLKKKLLIEVKGKPIIQYTIENALASKKKNRIIVATEDLDIKRFVDSLGYDVDCIRTPQFNNGTERVRHISKELLNGYARVVNLQADEPLFKADSIDAVFGEISNDIVLASAYSFIRNEAEYNDPNTVKVVLNVFDMALYFSRSSIPHGGFTSACKHIGIYGYKRDVLADLPTSSNYQKSENLEQLSWLENGYAIKMVRINYETIGIDTPENIESFKAALEK